MSFELQFSASVFSRIALSRIRSLPICIDQEIVDENNAVIFVVDHVDVLDGTTVQRERALDMKSLTESSAATQNVTILSQTNLSQLTVPWIQVKQPISVSIVTPDALQASQASATAPATGAPLTMSAVFNLGVFIENMTQGGSRRLILRYSFAYLHPGLAGFALSPAQLQNLQGTLASKLQIPAVALDLDVLSQAQGGMPGMASQGNFVNAGLATNLDATLVALRLESDTYNSPVRLNRQFFEDGPQDLLQGSDWAMLVDSDVIVSGVTAFAKEQLSKKSDVKLLFGPNVTWQPSRPGLSVYARLLAKEACTSFLDNGDMDVRVSIDITMSTPPGTDILRTRMVFDGEPAVLGQEIACAVTVGLLWPFLAPFILFKEDPTALTMGAYLGGFWIPPLFRMATLFFAMEMIGPQIPDDLGDKCTKVGDDTIECDEQMNLLVRLNPPLLTRLSLNQVVGFTAGLVMRGTVGNLTSRSIHGEIVVESTPMEWSITGSCPLGFGMAPKAQISALPDGLCFVRMLSADPMGAYALEQDGDTVTVRVRTPNNLPSYGCSVRVITDRGVRTITYPTPAAITPERQAALNTLIHNLKRVCQAKRDTFHERENVNWGRDDPIDQLEAIRLWELAVIGMNPSQALTISTPDGRRVLEAHASPRGAISAVLAFHGPQAANGLVLERAEHNRPASLTVRQSTFLKRFAIPHAGQVSGMFFDSSAPIPTLTIVGTDRTATWRMDHKRSPSLVHVQSSRNAPSKDASPAAFGDVIRSAHRLLDAGWRVHGLSEPPRNGARVPFLARRRDETALYDVADPDAPRLVQRHFEAPWFENCSSSGTMIARYVAESSEIEIYVRVGTNRPQDLATTTARAEMLAERQRMLLGT